VAPPAKPGAPKRSPAPPQDRGAEKRVRRGKLAIGGKLDLHGHTLVTGRAALMRFLHAAHDRGERTVIVITGVGRAGPSRRVVGQRPALVAGGSHIGGGAAGVPA